MDGRTAVLTLVAAAAAAAAQAQNTGVASTLHNLSSSGPGEIRALEEDRICRFCHVPHNAVVPQPLWGHALSEVSRYEVGRVRSLGGDSQPAPQPDGASRLCLSCHDGTIALGDLGEGAAPSLGPLGAGRRAMLGTDLSGGHPISFVVQGSAGLPDSDRDMGVRPLEVIRDPEGVSLDAEGKMQCTTCHDPHSDRYYEPGRVPRFWVRPSVDEVCLACHELR